jgi:UDP-3-O-[3-hydroxymyristoyl] glucosamine N-acyltransferase
VEDEVEIGANVTIDRAALGVTRIGRGTKVDNLVHIAHNVEVGPNCLLLGQVGISGSCQLGEGVTLGGQVGLTDHIRIGDRTIVVAKGGVIQDLPAGGVFSGMPVLPHEEQRGLHRRLRRLPELFKTVQGLLARVESLERGR